MATHFNNGWQLDSSGVRHSGELLYWVVDPSGNVLAQFDNRDHARDYFYMVSESEV